MEFVSANAPLPPLDQVLELSKADQSTEPQVSYGFREDDPTTMAVLSERFVPDTGWMAFRLVPQRRKRFEAWKDAEGRQMGRWTWESAAPRLDPLP